MTGLIYLVIIALWAAVLIPMWLKRHDQVSEVRSTTRFSTAMRSLGNQRSGENMPNPQHIRQHNGNSAHERATQRRTMVLGALTIVLAVTLVAAFASIAPKWLPIISAGLVTAFLVATLLTAPARKHSQRTLQAPVRAQQPRRAAAPVAVPAMAAEDDWENWNAWDDENSWEAVPSTLPTYVNSPRASVIPRPIDRARPDEWNGEAMVEAAATMRRHQEAAAAAPAHVDYHNETAEMPAVRTANA
ncbi:MAG: hypothetical protein Q7L55_07315 [Actinomycetota bacterium]|nr:hypothetical protein [Actinomycetota bacterium]